MKKRAATYLRVSKGEQATAKRLVRTRGLRVVVEYEEKISAAKARPKFDEWRDNPAAGLL